MINVLNGDESQPAGPAPKVPSGKYFGTMGLPAENIEAGVGVLRLTMFGRKVGNAETTMPADIPGKHFSVNFGLAGEWAPIQNNGNLLVMLKGVGANAKKGGQDFEKSVDYLGSWLKLDGSCGTGLAGLCSGTYTGIVHKTAVQGSWTAQHRCYKDTQCPGQRCWNVKGKKWGTCGAK